MPAIINHKICDQASACGGISVCPVGAFTYNEKTKRIEIDNDTCISCGACEKTCPIGAIGVARTQEEFDELYDKILSGDFGWDASDLDRLLELHLDLNTRV